MRPQRLTWDVTPGQEFATSSLWDSQAWGAWGGASVLCCPDSDSTP